MTEPTRIVAYADLLGFSDLVVKRQDAAWQLLSDFYNFAKNTKAEHAYEDLELFLFSDFLFVQGDQVETVVNYMCRLYRKALKYSDDSEEPMLIRGGVARGGVLTQGLRAAPRVTENFIVSTALTHAVKMEALAKGQRLLLSAKEREELAHFWNRGIEAICYDQPSVKPSKLFREYAYQDLLWARDLSAEAEDAAAETRALIKIAAKLFREHSSETVAVTSHYADTLRICLLSYSSLLSPSSEDLQFIRELIRDTLIPQPNSAVWLGFLESVLLSRDAFAFQNEPSMAQFLSVAVLSPAWGEVSTALHGKEHQQLLDAVREFLEHAIPDVQLGS